MSLLLCTLLSLYLGILLGMFLFQRKLMYLPNPAQCTIAALPGASLTTVTATDGITLQAIHLPAANPHLPTILYFHGNAGNLDDRMHKFRAFGDKGFGVLAVSYRGYGGSLGSPTEQGLYLDARAALHYAGQLGLPPSSLVYYGESLGSGIATQLATEQPPLALVLEAPYTSVAARAQETYRYLPVYWLVRDRYLSVDKIASIKAPLLLFHGEEDTVIPVHHGRALFAAAQEPKKGIFYPGINHTDFPLDQLTQSLYDFVTGLER